MLTLTVFANLRCSTTASSGTLLPSGSTMSGTLSLTRECAVEALPLVNAAVDLIGGVVIVEYYVSPPYAGNRQDGLPRVRDHQVGEVRSAEVGRQPQPNTYCFVLYVEIRDEAQLGYGLIQLGAPDARKGIQNPCLVYRHVGRSTAGFSVTAGPVPACSTCSSSGTSMSYSFAALRPRILRLTSGVSSEKSSNSSDSGICKSTNSSTSHFGDQIA